MKYTKKAGSTKVTFPDGSQPRYLIEGETESISQRKARELGVSHSMLPTKNK